MELDTLWDDSWNAAIGLLNCSECAFRWIDLLIRGGRGGGEERHTVCALSPFTWALTGRVSTDVNWGLSLWRNVSGDDDEVVVQVSSGTIWLIT